MDGLRRPHTKTRNGCGRCKQRKCDLRPPICSNCERRGEACDYSASQIRDPAQLRYIDNKLSNYSPPVSFELALHFDALTSSTFDLPETPLIWRKDLVKRAERQSYLRYSSLALAALHITHLRPKQSDVNFLYNNAHAYQNEGYALFRREVKLIDQENGLDVLAFCVMTAMFHFSASLIGHTAFDGAQQMDVISPLLALRSGASLLRTCRDVTVHHQSLFGALGRHGAAIDESALLSEQRNQKAIEALENAILFLNTAECSTLATLHAFAVLRKVFTIFPPSPEGWFHVIFWPAMVLDDYFDELREEQPAAVIAFVYWCAYLNRSMKQWYLEEWPQVAALHKMTTMDPKWDDVLAWPRHRLGLLCPDRKEMN